MAQVCTVIQADPQSLATALAALNSEVLIVEKTSSAGKFLIVHQSPSTGQTYSVIAGDPAKLAGELQTLATGGATVNFVAATFSASHYVIGYVP
jgi:phosphodiesterase/alkaline phosphatase D-like protein